MVGSDLETGAGRMTFDVAECGGRHRLHNIAMGVFGFARSSAISRCRRKAATRQCKVTGLMPTAKT